MALLREIGVPPRLYRHAELVGEAADLLLAGLQRFRVQVDEEYVRVGAALHDAGKALHPSELTGPGNNHEIDGERLLLSHGTTPDVARVCRSHAQWDTVAETVEELLIALSDKALERRSGRAARGARHRPPRSIIAEGSVGLLHGVGSLL